MAELNKKSSIKYDSDKIDQKVSKNQNSMKIEQMNFDISETNDLQIVRCHWIQLYKLNLQHSLIEETLTYIFENYANIRNIFHFGRRINLKQENWRKILKNDAHFHYHCTNIQCAITTIMDKLEDEISLRNFLIKLGNRHFFYNVYEIHLTIFQEAIITTLRQLLLKIDLNDKNLEKSWRIFMNEIKEKISAGIAKQRTYYLENCLNVKELQLISDLWNHINHNNHSELAKILYEQLNENEAISKTNMQQDGVYDEFCTFLIKVAFYFDE
ncbi:unnamed protein product [Dracunculus medinensis]|uniref:GLOBIN domain-containing protein n=1 Tax=Dracunculus medinensis TaxID=318479 RepID=A0A0N4U493_DRAME|nr:unnamed protein product [Dracunculus medinensis]